MFDFAPLHLDAHILAAGSKDQEATSPTGCGDAPSAAPPNFLEWLAECDIAKTGEERRSQAGGPVCKARTFAGRRPVVRMNLDYRNQGVGWSHQSDLGGGTHLPPPQLNRKQ